MFTSCFPILNSLASKKSNVLFVGSGEKLYETHRRLFNKRFNLHPKIIAICKTTQGVQRAVQYVNYPERNIKNYGIAYYGENYLRLQKLKQKLDPYSRFL